MRSIAGVGTTPPNVPGAPKPTSSVMMSSTLGAPFGGTTRGGHQAVDSDAFSLITPPNFGSGAGSCFPLMLVVALGEPGSLPFFGTLLMAHSFYPGQAGRVFQPPGGADLISN